MKLEPVVWTKGTLLNPQHLQHQDRFLEGLLQFQLENLVFRPSGFRRLEFSQSALAGGALGISRASGIFPDGLLFDIPDSDSAPDVKPLADHFGPDEDTVDLYLAVPQYRERGLNLASQGSSAAARYRAEIAVFRDENTGTSEKPIRVARKNLRLLAEDEPREGYTTLRIARVRRTPAGTMQLDPRFVPSLIDIFASEYLVSINRRLVEILSARSSSISRMRRQKNQSLADFTAADISSFWLLYSVNTAFPLFRHIFETRGGHPERLYAAMLALAGALTTFSAKIQPRDLPTYDHENLGACFTDLDEKLRTLLETVIPTNFVALPLKLAQPAIYATAIDNDKYFENTRMYLAIGAEAAQAKVAASVPQLVKVGSGNQIEHLVRQALPGVPLLYAASPPSTVQVNLSYQYFSISQGGDAWEKIVRERTLAAYVPDDLPNPQLELIIVLPAAG
jgi:type VI secretion system protein ImpJ